MSHEIVCFQEMRRRKRRRRRSWGRGGSAKCKIVIIVFVAGYYHDSVLDFLESDSFFSVSRTTKLVEGLLSLERSLLLLSKDSGVRWQTFAMISLSDLSLVGQKFMSALNENPLNGMWSVVAVFIPFSPSSLPPSPLSLKFC